MSDLNYTTVYHPVTSEPFEVPHAKAADLRLNHGWLSHPIDPTAVAAVQETALAEEVQEVQDRARRGLPKDAS